MAGEKHLYLVVGGAYEDSSDHPERWQFGVRLALVFGGIDDIASFPTNWDVQPRADTHTNGNWDTVTNFDVSGPGATTFDTQSWMEDYAQPSAEALFGTGVTAAGVTLDTLKLSPIDSLGHVIDARTTTSSANADIHGDAGGSIMPLQCSVAVSTRTPVVGPKGRGRFYLPPVIVGVLGSHGRLDPTWVAEVATETKAFLEGLTYAAGSPSGPHVHAVVTGGAFTHYGIINGVRVGDLVDTQRRRRRQLKEVYTSETVDP